MCSSNYINKAQYTRHRDRPYQFHEILAHCISCFGSVHSKNSNPWIRFHDDQSIGKTQEGGTHTYLHTRLSVAANEVLHFGRWNSTVPASDLFWGEYEQMPWRKEQLENTSSVRPSSVLFLTLSLPQVSQMRGLIFTMGGLPSWCSSRCVLSSSTRPFVQFFSLLE